MSNPIRSAGQARSFGVGAVLGTRDELSRAIDASWSGGELGRIVRRWEGLFARRFRDCWWRSFCRGCGVLVQAAGQVELDHVGTSVSLNHWCCPVCGDWSSVETSPRRAEWFGKADDAGWQVATRDGMVVVNAIASSDPPSTPSWLFDPTSDDGDMNRFLEMRATADVKRGELVIVPKRIGENAIRLAQRMGFEVQTSSESDPQRLARRMERVLRPCLSIAAAEEWSSIRPIAADAKLFASHGEMWLSTSFHLHHVSLASSENAPATVSGRHAKATGMCAGPDGVYVADGRTKGVWHYPRGSDAPYLFAGSGEERHATQTLAVLLMLAVVVTIGIRGGAAGLAVALLNLAVLTTAGLARHLREGAPATAARFVLPAGLALTPDGELLVCDRGSGRIRKIDDDGHISTVAGARWAIKRSRAEQRWLVRLCRPSGIVVATSGAIFVSDARRRCVFRLDTDGSVTAIAGGSRRANGGDGVPAEESRLGRPEGLAFDRDDGLLVADRSNHRVRLIGADGIIHTVAGSGSLGSSGDGGPARPSKLNSPTSVAVGPDGSVYIADAGNHRVRVVRRQLVSPGTEPSTGAG